MVVTRDRPALFRRLASANARHVATHGNEELRTGVVADAPFAEAFGLNWLWMLLAGAVGVGAYSYDRHRKKAAANEEMKKYKK